MRADEPGADMSGTEQLADEMLSRVDREHETGARLARLYLEATGLSAAALAEAAEWVMRVPIYSEETLGPEIYARYQAIAPRYEAIYRLARALPEGERAINAELERGSLARDEVQAITNAYRAAVERGEAPPDAVWRWYAPSLKIENEMVLLAEAAVAGKERLRPAKLAALLTDAKGVRHPDPITWARARYPGEPVWTITLAFERIAREEAERRADTETAKREKLEKKLERLKRRPEFQLGDRTVMPRQLIEAGWTTDTARHQLTRIEQGELFPADARSLEMLRRAEATVEGRQFGRLPAPEVRALMAVLRVFSSGGDDRRQFRHTAVTVPARLLYHAAGVDPRKSALCRNLVAALDALGRRQVYASLKFQEPAPKGDTDAPRREFVMGEHTAVFRVTPVWRDRSEREASKIAQQWARRGMLQPHEDAEPWDGPLPDEYMLELPPIMAKVWGALVLDGDVLGRLEAGAKRERGERQGFQSIDWALFMEITQHTQAGQVSSDGRSLKSYVDRDDFLAGFYGAAEVAKYRASGRYASRCVKQYEHAAGVLVAGGLVQEYQPQRQIRRRVCDVFVLAPDMVRGLEGRALKATTRAATKAKAKVGQRGRGKGGKSDR